MFKAFSYIHNLQSWSRIVEKEQETSDYNRFEWKKYLPAEASEKTSKVPFEGSGIINLNKPAGISSMDAIRVIRKVFQIKKAGHGGTLDPMAEGVLPIFIGKATSFAQNFLTFHKTYEGIFRLGKEYDTQDISGKVVSEEDGPHPVDLTLESLNQYAITLTGDIEQTPPVYSAVKKGGQPLYKLARKGVHVTPEPRKVSVIRFEITEQISPTDYRFLVESHKGVYVRTLLHDLAILAGTRGAMAQLTRTSSGPLKIDRSVTLEQLARSESPEPWLISPEELELT